MMLTKFSCDGSNMEEILEKLRSVEEHLNTAYSQAAAVKDEIDSKTCWTGKSQKTMAAFLDLLTQYHKDFIQGGKAPVPKGIEYLEDLQKSLDDFYDGWPEYQDLEAIK